MATRKPAASRAKSRTSARSGGSTLYGLLAGLFLGLLVAAVVAFYVTRAPVPFVDRASRDAPRRPAIDPKVAPDPNSALYARNNRGDAAGAGPSGAATTTPPGAQSDDLGALIATLDTTANGAANTPNIPNTATAPPASTGSYFLQVGAYRVVEDAEALRARILMLGLPVTLQRAEVNGALVNRVRVGPYNQLDDMNRARTRLGQERIVSTVVRQ